MTLALEISALSKVFDSRKDQVVAARSLSLAVGEGEFFSILGPSGCGKSTLLRMIAGLEKPDSGRISIAGTKIFDSECGVDLSPERRGLGMVFQSFAIWPHMTALQNVTFPLRAKNLGGARMKSAAMEALAAVALADKAEHSAAFLSGGQKQRLALARAIVSRPKLILLDEPLSNLDAQLRDQLRQMLRSLQAELGLTFIYVTHDQGEALSMSHRIAIMSDGDIQQVGSPLEIYRSPKNEFVGRFVGDAHFLAVADGRAMIRPEDIELKIGEDAAEGWSVAKVIAREFFGSHVQLTISSNSGPIAVRVEASFSGNTGDTVSFRPVSDKLIFLPNK